MNQIEPPKAPANWRGQLVHQMKSIPLQQWKTNALEYLKIVPWQQWGFVAIAIFGYVCYLFIGFWLWLLFFFVGLLISMTFRGLRRDSAAEQGFLYWIERIITEIIRPLIPARVRATMGKRVQAYQIPALLMKGAFHLARPNRLTFSLGCTVLLLWGIVSAQQLFFPTIGIPPRLPEKPSKDLPQQYRYPSSSQPFRYERNPRVPTDYD
jgi:hypothetical protein